MNLLPPLRTTDSLTDHKNLPTFSKVDMKLIPKQKKRIMLLCVHGPLFSLLKFLGISYFLNKS